MLIADGDKCSVAFLYQVPGAQDGRTRLTSGAHLQITGVSMEKDGYRYWPIEIPATRKRGYVQEGCVTAQPISQTADPTAAPGQKAVVSFNDRCKSAHLDPNRPGLSNGTELKVTGIVRTDIGAPGVRFLPVEDPSTKETGFLPEVCLKLIG